jgi:hypothetical protein
MYHPSRQDPALGADFDLFNKYSALAIGAYIWDAKNWPRGPYNGAMWSEFS